MQTFTVFGNYGELLVEIDGDVGVVVGYKPSEDGDDYKDIVNFDIGEWTGYYPEIIAGRDVDIMDIGFWDDKGNYYGPTRN